LAKERKKEFKINRVDRFRYRTRYFSDSGIMGTKEFVSINIPGLKIFLCQNEKKYPSLWPVWMGFIH
jgi:putative transposase